jgi:DNA-binding CsgD family transcriptional regulator
MKKIRIRVACELEIPDHRDVLSPSEDETEHLMIDGKFYQPDITWLEYKGKDAEGYLTIRESNMREITSPFAKRLSGKYPGLTPAEVQTVGLIREGKTTKEIAELLCVSENTVSSNRFHIFLLRICYVCHGM